ncbi:hypothetical protein PSTG_11180 [Puccinia striiformis f. sp. tritici PST-78]|uniref:Aspartate aminotransferase n=2 Tax=Puccinia striiformis f. sp. tritici TaxID=168172 RepID=A0A0L0V865_9BASI|nr:hypothetical protein PSTG_11180 [Puccinia striiformis f. sp. tritici PST-78]
MSLTASTECLMTGDALRPAHNAQQNGISLKVASTWSNVPPGPPNPILAVGDAFRACTSPLKMNLGVGAYRDEEGKPFVLPSVRKAEAAVVAAKYDKEYLGTTGLPEFTKAAALLAYGLDSVPLQEGRIATCQTISGTGAIKLGGDFLQKFYPHHKVIYVPTPTWGCHIPMFQESGFEVKQYRYYDKETVALDFTGMLDDIRNAPHHSIILLHPCAHNPTGVDPTSEQWQHITDIIKEKSHLTFFDMAYQGFASGDVDRDAGAPRYFVSQGLDILLAQSFSKNMGLYGERAGLFSVVCSSSKEKIKIESQLELMVRHTYLNPPVHGARIASTILNDPELYKQWLSEVKLMADRIIGMRTALYDNLVNELGSQRNWGHIKSQVGMFCYTGISPEQVEQITQKHYVFMTKDGRISMAGVTSQNVKHLAQALHDVTQ